MKHLLTVTLPLGIIAESYSGCNFKNSSPRSSIAFGRKGLKTKERNKEKKTSNNCPHELFSQKSSGWKSAGMSLLRELRDLSLKGTICARTHTNTRTQLHIYAFTAPRLHRRNQYAPCCLLRYRLPNNNQWNCLAVLASLWDDVSELSCWRYSWGTEPHALAACWQTQVMFWTRPWINIAFRCCCENSHLLQARASEWGFNSCIGGFVTEREKCYIQYYFFYPFLS